MDKTPKGKSLKFVKSTASSSVSKPNRAPNKTPVKESKKPRIWETDICSQDQGDNDVAWDWDSPKNIKPKAQKVVRRSLQKSPVVVPKKASQVDHAKEYEKLREELQALRDEISRTDDCFPLSPVDEQTFREESAKDCNDIDSFIEEQYFHIENQERECLKSENEHKNAFIDELLDDSCDEQLFNCTQAIEEKLDRKPVKSNLENKLNDVESNRMASLLRSADDSFDAVLKGFGDDDIELLTQTNNNKTFCNKKSENSDLGFKRTFSDANVEYVSRKAGESKVGKFTFHRTHSFESSATSKIGDLPNHVRDEIERKRREAQARLREKKEKEKLQATKKNVNELYANVSPLKCSPEEIEQKRLQAKAIREAKQKEMIEKNRIEALKRLEMNRMRRQDGIKTSQMNRL